VWALWREVPYGGFGGLCVDKEEVTNGLTPLTEDVGWKNTIVLIGWPVYIYIYIAQLFYS
jgi:hypothetical protein